MLPWAPRSWGPGGPPAPEEAGPSLSAGPVEAWSPRETAAGSEPVRTPEDNPRPRAQSRCRTQRELRPQRPNLVAQQSRGTPGAPVSDAPHRVWRVRPTRVALLMPWDPKYKVKTRGSQLWGAGSSSGGSFSNRTLCHPSFWPLYRATPYRSLGPKAPGSEAEQSSTPTDIPVLSSEDVFLSDPLLPLCPLLPQCQRIPLHLSKPPEQVKGSLKLLLPPSIMASSVMPSHILGSSSTRLSRAELIALKGLLQMSQGEPKPSSSSGASDNPPNRVSYCPGPVFNTSDNTSDPVSEPSDPLFRPSRPVSDPLRSSGGRSSHSTGPSLPPTL